jgi:hypothetical protein
MNSDLVFISYASVGELRLQETQQRLVQVDQSG